MFKKKLLPVHSLTVLTLLLNTQAASAKCGSVNYSWGADALASAHDFTVTMMLYVLYLSYAIAGIMCIISALQIYFKMQTGEGEITKHIMSLVGSCLFMVGASIVFPAFFGYRI
ncbi:MAG: DUF4134 domain-containing protein [Bacteroidaceae bacterium]|nr:DUF4134 domain-containing protein [Bacteroidaceae bacterium]